MLKKIIVGAIAAGAMSVPLAGAALAQPSHHGNNGNGHGNSVGAGGIPGRIQSNFGLTAPVPPGQWLNQIRQQAPAGQSLPQYLRSLPTPIKSPGQIVSGIAHGSFPTSEIPTPVVPAPGQ